MHEIISRFNTLRSSLSRLGSRPALDWYFMLSVFAATVAIVIIVDAVVYYKVAIIDSPAIAPADAQRKTLNREEILRTIELIEQREVSARTIPRSVAADPSL